MSVATSLVFRTIARQVMPALTDALGGDKKAATEATKKILLELDGKRLDGMFSMAERELTGSQEQREWRPKWMNNIRHLLTAYFALSFAMGAVSFIGVAIGSAWPTGDEMMMLVSAWADLGKVLLTLTTASFAIYGVGRTVEKVTETDGLDKVMDYVKKIPSGLKRKKADPNPPVVYRTVAGKRVPVQTTKKPKLEPEPSIDDDVDIELDMFKEVDDSTTWEPDSSQEGRRIPADWEKKE